MIKPTPANRHLSHQQSCNEAKMSPKTNHLTTSTPSSTFSRVWSATPVCYTLLTCSIITLTLGHLHVQAADISFHMHHQLQHHQNVLNNNNNNNNNNNINNQMQPPPTQVLQQHQQQTIALQQQSFPHNQLSHQLNPYTRATHDLLLDVRQQMLTKSIKFDEHFRNLLSASKLSLHNMFADTYGMMYEHNTEIFTSMFEDLEQYYANGQIKLTKSMENFFERLYQKIFQVYNSNRAFSPGYLECATEQLTHLKPFKDVPEKLIDEIKHAFVAARTFVQVLNSGIDIIKSIISLGQPTQCINLINEKLLKNSPQTQISNSNSHPASTGARPPCLTFCEQVISRCIGRSNLEQLNDRWRGYVTALYDLASKLSTSYNIETIIAPLDVQISEAIMNFQENAQNISQHVFQTCGKAVSTNSDYMHISSLKPSPDRLGKRAAPAIGVSMPLTTVTNSDHRRQLLQQSGSPLSPSSGSSSSSNNNNNNHNLHNLSPFQALPGSLNLNGHLRVKDGLLSGSSIVPDDFAPIGQKSPLLIDEIRNYMFSTKSFWSSLPNAVCTSNYTLGANVTRKQTNCFYEPFNLTEMNSDLRYHAEIKQQVSRLEITKARIESALAGVEIDWHDRDGSQQASASFAVNNQRLTTPAGGSHPKYIQQTTTTTSTTTTPDPLHQDDNEEPEDYELGSGDSQPEDNHDDHEYVNPEEVDSEFSTENPDLEEDGGQETTQNGEAVSASSDPNNNYPSTKSPPNGSQQPPSINTDFNQDNVIDQPLQPISSDIHSNLITAGDMDGLQKSGQASSWPLSSGSVVGHAETYMMLLLTTLLGLILVRH